MRWTGNGLADGTALTAGNVNTAGNGDTVARGASGTPTYWRTAGDGFEVEGNSIIARLDASFSAIPGSRLQEFFTGVTPGAATDEILSTRSASTRGASIAIATSGRFLIFDGAGGVSGVQSPVQIPGHRYQLDLIAQQAASPTSSNGRIVARVIDLDDPTWGTGGKWFYDSSARNIAGAGNLTVNRFGRTNTATTQSGGWLFEQLGWDSVTLPAAVTVQADVEAYFMDSPYVSTFTGAGELTAPVPTLAAAGSVTDPIYSGSGALVAPVPTLAGSATNTDPVASTGALVAPVPTLAGSGSVTDPTYSASGALVAPVPTVAGSATNTDPVATTGALTGPKTTIAGVGSVSDPVYSASGALLAPTPDVSGVASTYVVEPIIPVPIVTAGDVLYGDRITSYRWEVLEHSNGIDHLVGILDGVSDGKLVWTQNAAVKGGGTVSVVDLDQAAPGMLDISELTLTSVRLRPVLVVAGLPENPLGVFLVSAAVEDWRDTGRVWGLQLLDKCTVPSQDVVDESYAVAAGTVILQEVKTILASSGEYMDIDESSTLATSTGMVWEAGTSKLKIINDLLDVAGYNALWMDGYGNFKATPRVLPANRSVTYELLGIPRELLDGEQGIYSPDWTLDRDSFDVPNKVIAVEAAGGEDTAALVGQWTNTDASSPYSYPSRGRWIPHVLDSVEVPAGTDPEKIAFLEARARTTLVQMSAVQATVKVDHLPIPVRVSDVVRFGNTKAGVDGKHVITRLTLDTSPLGLMNSTLQEVISL